MTKETILTRWWKNFSLKKIEAGVLWLSVFISSWQLRHTIFFAAYGGNYFEYPSIHLYATDVLMVILLGLWVLRGARNHVVPKWVWQPVIFWLVWLTVGGWYGLAWQNSLQQSVHYWLMAGWLMYVVNNVKDIKQLLWPLVWGAGFQAIWGGAQFLLNRDLGMQILGESPLSPNQGGVMVVGDETHRQIRAYGLLPHPNMLAGLLVVSVFPLIKLFVKVGKKYRVVALGLATVIGLGLVLAFSRMAWGLAMISLLVAVVLVLTQKSWRSGGWVIGVMLVVVSMGLWWQWPNVAGRFELDSALETKSVTERIVGLQTWGQAVTGHDLAGLGTGNYTVAMIALNPEQLVWTYKPIHNIYLLITAENGAIGITLWLWLVGVVLWLWFKLVRQDWKNLWVGAPLVVILVAGMLDHWSVSFQQGRLLFFLALALIILEARVYLERQK
jgi:hypothetical protein